MAKPFYSRRRLKKMGVVFIESNTKINLQLKSVGGNIKQHMNIIKIIKNSDKDIVVTIDSCSSGSCSSWLNN